MEPTQPCPTARIDLAIGEIERTLGEIRRTTDDALERRQFQLIDELEINREATRATLAPLAVWHIGVLLIGVAASLGLATLLALPAWTGFLAIGGLACGAGAFLQVVNEARVPELCREP